MEGDTVQLTSNFQLIAMELLPVDCGLDQEHLLMLQQIIPRGLPQLQQTTDQDYVLRRTATDNDGATGSDTVTITVRGTSAPSTQFIFRFDTIAELETFGTVTLGTNDGFWELLDDGRTGSSNTGPGSNSAGPYVATDATGASLDDLEENSVVDLNITSQWPQATDRILLLRVAVIGDFGDTDEGLRVQGRTGSGAWVDIELISGWSYSESYVVGSALGVYSGDARECVQDGGWADVEIVIPDAYDDLRFGPIATAGDAFTHDIALWSVELTNSGAPVSEVIYDFRYREVGTPNWTTVEDIDALTYTTTGLDPEYGV